MQRFIFSSLQIPTVGLFRLRGISLSTLTLFEVNKDRQKSRASYEIISSTHSLLGRSICFLVFT